MSDLRLLVCGNRDFSCADTIRAWLLPFHARWQKIGGIAPLLIHGAAKGADSIAHDIAFKFGWRIQACPADWDKHGNSAGPIRNREMFKQWEPTRGLAFGRLTTTGFDNRSRLTGTGDMVTVMNEGGIIVTVVPRAGVMP